MYKWAPRNSGWAIGKVTVINTDKRKKVGVNVANFIVYYEVDKAPASHFLTLHGYAVSCKAAVDSWALSWALIQ